MPAQGAPRTPTPPTAVPALANNKNNKEGLMDPPPKIRNPNNGLVYTRLQYLGEVSEWLEKLTKRLADRGMLWRSSEADFGIIVTDREVSREYGLS